MPLHGCGILVRWEAGIRVCGKNHGTGLVGDTVIQVCGNIVKELVDCLGSVLMALACCELMVVRVASSLLLTTWD